MNSQAMDNGLFSYEGVNGHKHEHKEQTLDDESGDESDFFADFYEEEEWTKLTCSKSTDQDDAAASSPNSNDMVMDLSNVLPVGGMRRVSSCYFSICSNVSSDEQNANTNNESRIDSPFTSVVDEYENRSTANFLYHDILMNVFSYLDAHSLASFSETGKRPNFECFYFLELQLQRALLRGTAARLRGGEGVSFVDGVGDWERHMELRGCGAISRLAAMDETKAREIVQTYLDSNSSIRAMPLSHSLAYLRQVLSQHGLQNMKMRMPQPPVVPAMDDILPAKNARNMALFFTFLGAAYMHGAAPDIPDPSDVINAENAAALRDALLKMGLAGGVLKTMKEAAAKSVGAGGDSSILSEDQSINNNGNESAHRESRLRPSSIGSLEDLSQMLPANIASRLYNVFSNNASTLNVPVLNEQSEQKVDEENFEQDEATLPQRRPHRSKRSHSSRHMPDAVHESKEDAGSNLKSTTQPAIPALVDENNIKQEVAKSTLTPDEIAKAMKNPISSNPYDHHTPSFNTDNELNNASSLFSFHTTPTNTDNSLKDNPLDSGEVPSGCVGAYARAVKNSAARVTSLIKQQRKLNFEALDVDEQLQLGLRFIDACSSDSKLPIVRDILQKQNCMDVDRFFLGPDETETCALHAAAFNGADQVLEFLSGGIDEYNPGLDTGLCDVDIRDANGWTALHFAAGANSVSSVRILAEHGAKLTIEAGNGYTPYHWAERLSNEEVAQELQRLGADNRFVGGWIFGSSSASRSTDSSMPFISFLANRFFGNSR